MSAPRQAEVLAIDPDHPDPTLVTRAARALRDGRLVALPTETVYGLGCDAFDEVAIERVFVAKGRPASDPLIVHVAGSAMLDRVVAGTLPAAARALVEAFWPGPLTLVLPRHPGVPLAVTAGLETVAVRAPAHPVAAAIIAAAAIPVAAPSANRFGHISPTSAAHVLADLGDRCDLVVDAGRTQQGLESTVVAVRDRDVAVLRHGMVTVEELRAHCPLPVVDQDEAHAHQSPGHEARHYAPRTPTLAVVAGLLPSAGALPPDLATAGGVAYLGYADRRPSLPTGWSFEDLGSLDSLPQVAHDLYEVLHRVDGARPELILVELTGQEGLGRAIDDRLRRAASSVVVRTADELATAWAGSGPARA